MLGHIDIENLQIEDLYAPIGVEIAGSYETTIETYIKLVEDLTGGFIDGDVDEFISIPYSAEVLDIYKTKLSKKNFMKFVHDNPYIDFSSKNSMLDAICESLIKNTELEYLPIETIVEKEFI